MWASTEPEIVICIYGFVELQFLEEPVIWSVTPTFLVERDVA